MAATSSLILCRWKTVLIGTRITAKEILSISRCKPIHSAAYVTLCSVVDFAQKDNLPRISEVIGSSFSRISLRKYSTGGALAPCSRRDTHFHRRWLHTSAFCLEHEVSGKGTKKTSIRQRFEKVKEMREDVLTIPNLLSASRIIAAPFLSYFIITEQFLTAVLLFGFAGITDMLDGYIARNFKNQRSVFGTVLDPLADKVLMSTLTISLTFVGLLPVPLTALILGRDVLLIAAAFYFRFKSLPPPKTFSRYFDVNLVTVELRPNVLGKANTVFQLGLVGCTLLAPVFGFVGHPYLQGLWYIVGASTLMSSVSYLFASNTAVRYLK